MCRLVTSQDVMRYAKGPIIKHANSISTLPALECTFNSPSKPKFTYYNLNLGKCTHIYTIVESYY